MHQDEGRFGRISIPRSSWEPKPVRPLVCRQVVRESTYAYSAIAPHEGLLISIIRRKCNTEHMQEFFDHLVASVGDRHILMFLDGAGWHKAKRLVIPANLTLEFQPPYTPEVNPVEHLWDHLREKHFANRIFLTLDAVEDQVKTGLEKTAADKAALISLSCFSWMKG